MSNLQLNERPYKDFYGRNVDQMPNLIAEGRTPISVAGLMERKLEVRDAKYSPEVRAAWHDNSFDTGDGILYHPDGKIKIVTDSQTLRGISSESKLSGGALVLPAGAYEAAEGYEFSKKDLKGISRYLLTRDQAKTNPLWKALARDQERLNAYVDFVFDETQRRFGYDKNMGLDIGSAQKEPTERLWFVGWLSIRSNAVGRLDLNSGDGHLVGVAPEARSRKSAVSDSALEAKLDSE
jgi:hypothetical protein